MTDQRQLDRSSTPEPTALKVAQDLAHEMNESDTSVGFYPFGTIDKDTVEWLEEAEGVKVKSFTTESAVLDIGGERVLIFLFKFPIPGTGEWEAHWEARLIQSIEIIREVIGEEVKQ